MMTTARLKDLGEFRNGLTYSPENICDADEGILVLRSSNIQDEKISLLDNVYVNVSLPKNMLVSDGDILICSRNGSARLVGKTAIIENGLHATWGAFMMLFKTPQNSKYMYYLLNASISKSKGLFSTSTINQLTNSMLGNIYVEFFNDKQEQRQIVSYLDAKTAAIDKRIAVLEKKQEVYSRLRRSIINRAVTRGLNPNVPLKDSGVDWIGMIPEHWGVRRMKDVTSLFGRIGFRGYTADDLVEEGEGAITLSPTNIIDGKINYQKCSYLSWEKYYESPEIMVENGDIVLVKTASVGKCALVENLPLEATLNPQFVVLKNIKCDSKYLLYILQSYVQNYMNVLKIGSAVPTISQAQIYNFRIILPPLPEQHAIADYLDEKCTKIDAAVANIGKQIDALKRLKRALINEVVTGKRKV